MAKEVIKCPEGHTRIWKVGIVPTRTGPKERYKCVVCARTFYAPEKPKRVYKKRVKKAG